MQGIHFGFWSGTVSHEAFECFALVLIITANSVLSFFSYPFCASLIPIRSLATFSPREIGQQSRPSGIPTTRTMNLRLRLWSFALQSSKAFCALCLSVKTCSVFARRAKGVVCCHLDLAENEWEWQIEAVGNKDSNRIRFFRATLHCSIQVNSYNTTVQRIYACIRHLYTWNHLHPLESLNIT